MNIKCQVQFKFIGFVLQTSCKVECQLFPTVGGTFHHHTNTEYNQMITTNALGFILFRDLTESRFHDLLDTKMRDRKLFDLVFIELIERMIGSLNDVITGHQEIISFVNYLFFFYYI